MNTAVQFACIAAALSAGHHVGDYWLQSHTQATCKGMPGWRGRRACAGHVATYTLALLACVALAAWWLSLALNPVAVIAGLAVSAVTHYFADRRRPLRWLASLLPRKLEFFDSGAGLASGAAFMDQSWHWFWLFISALVMTGGPR